MTDKTFNAGKKGSIATISADRQLYQRQIEATDRQIDYLVYELTQEKIEIVEDITR